MLVVWCIDIDSTVEFQHKLSDGMSVTKILDDYRRRGCIVIDAYIIYKGDVIDVVKP